jgi:hypothetical protein
MERQPGAWPIAERSALTNMLCVSSSSDLEAVKRNGADLLYIFDKLHLWASASVERRRLERHILGYWGGLLGITFEVGRARIAAFD